MLSTTQKLNLIMGILVALIVTDILLVRAYDVISKKFISTDAKEFLFAIISISILSSQYVLMRYVRPRNTGKHARDRTRILQMYITVRIVQYGLGALVVFVIIQILLLSYYSTSLLSVLIIISYSFSAGILCVFIARMLSWTSIKKASIPLIVFVIALGSVTVNATVGMIDASLRIGDRPVETHPFLSGSMDVSKGRFDLIDNLYFVTYLFSFITAWFAAATVLSHYIRQLGKGKYWLIMLVPLAFFFAQFTPSVANFLSPILKLDSFTVVRWTTVIVTVSKPVAGFMLAFQFWAIAKVTSKSNIRFYFTISGFGFLLLFTCNQAILMSITPYPPFGIATVTIMGMSAYLVVLGVYSSSISVSSDLELRNSMRRFARTEGKLIHSIASMENEKELENKVKEIIRSKLLQTEEKTGVESSFDESDVADYIKEVRKEITKLNSAK
jgi:hypothetical protein